MKKVIRIILAVTIPITIYSAIFAITPEKIAIFEGKKANVGYSFSLKGTENLRAEKNSKKMALKLWGIIPVKNVSVNVIPQKMLVPCGNAFGVKLFTRGVMVVGMSDIETTDGTKNPAYDCGIRVKDIVLKIGNKDVNSINEFTKALDLTHGKNIDLTVLRNNKEFIAKLTPAFGLKQKKYMAGLWVRDSTAGIGTMTFYDPDSKVFGGLGHGICDVDTGELMPLKTGSIVGAKIVGIAKGQKGVPGEIKGMFSGEDIGELSVNSDCGIFGTLNDSSAINTENVMPVATSGDIEVGDAKILCTLNGKVEEYKIKISKINRNSGTSTKNMIIEITDPVLLEKTGGIVQGMSGSPIIQNGNLIGAVTHVLIKDPTKGYGIFIENMLYKMREKQGLSK